MEKIGRFEIVGKLGRGAFGMVYKGRDPMINRLAAIKVMSEATVGDPELVARLDRVHAGHVENRKKAQRWAARLAVIKKRTWPVEIIGKRQVPATPAINLSPLPTPTDWAAPSRWKPTGTGTDVPPIPDFLDRVPAAPRPAATNEADPTPGTGSAFRQVA